MKWFIVLLLLVFCGCVKPPHELYDFSEEKDDTEELIADFRALSDGKL